MDRAGATPQRFCRLHRLDRLRRQPPRRADSRPCTNAPPAASSRRCTRISACTAGSTCVGIRLGNSPRSRPTPRLQQPLRLQ